MTIALFAAVRGNSRVEIAVLVVSGRTVHASSLGGHDGRRLSHERSPVHHVYRAPDKLPWPISGGPVSRHPGIDSGMGQSCASTYRWQDRTMRDDHCATCASPASHYLRPSAVPVGGLDGPFEVGGSQSVAGRFARFRAPSSRPVCHRDDAARRAWRRHQPPPAHNSVLAQHLLDAPGAASCRAWPPRPQRAGGGRPGEARTGLDAWQEGALKWQELLKTIRGPSLLEVAATRGYRQLSGRVLRSPSRRS